MRKKLFLMSFLIVATVQAETIESSYSYHTNSVKAGTTTKICFKEAFITRNSGTLVTGLGTANLKPYNVIEKKLNSSTGSYTSKTVAVTYSLSATSLSGTYNVCFTPNAFVWQANATYNVDAIIKGTSANDNGLFHLTWTAN